LTPNSAKIEDSLSQFSSFGKDLISIFISFYSLCEKNLIELEKKKINCCTICGEFFYLKK
jgi:hypothetical protein